MLIDFFNISKNARNADKDKGSDGRENNFFFFTKSKENAA
jgi:hypothetical protein